MTSESPSEICWTCPLCSVAVFQLSRCWQCNSSQLGFGPTLPVSVEPVTERAPNDLNPEPDTERDTDTEPDTERDAKRARPNTEPDTERAPDNPKPDAKCAKLHPAAPACAKSHPPAYDEAWSPVRRLVGILRSRENFAELQEVREQARLQRLRALRQPLSEQQQYHHCQ